MEEEEVTAEEEAEEEEVTLRETTTVVALLETLTVEVEIVTTIGTVVVEEVTRSQCEVLTIDEEVVTIDDVMIDEEGMTDVVTMIDEAVRDVTTIDLRVDTEETDVTDRFLLLAFGFVSFLASSFPFLFPLSQTSLNCVLFVRLIN